MDDLRGGHAACLAQWRARVQSLTQGTNQGMCTRWVAEATGQGWQGYPAKLTVHGKQVHVHVRLDWASEATADAELRADRHTVAQPALFSPDMRADQER